MVRAEFPERSYEISYNTELSTGAGGSPFLFTPSQLLEKVIGFDGARDPDALHEVWRALNVPRPSGVVLTPHHWSGSPLGIPTREGLSGSVVSLILQFKRPEYMVGRLAAQWNLWGAPDFRFERDRQQHAVLKRLEVGLAGQAIVRYASPAFHTLDHLEAAQRSRTVIQQSGHVAPATLGSHTVWTYQTPGANGRGNPEGHPRRFEAFEEIFAAREVDELLAVSSAVAKVDAPEHHLQDLARVAAMREPVLRARVETWRGRLLAAGISRRLIAPLSEFATVQSLLHRVGASWWLVDGSQIDTA